MARSARELVGHFAAPPDVDGLGHVAARVSGERVRAVIESMTGARAMRDLSAARHPHIARGP